MSAAPRSYHEELRAAREAAVRSAAPRSLVEAALFGNAAATAQLLETASASDVNALDEETQSALHYAAGYNESAIVALLLAHAGVAVNVRNKRGATPLHAAAVSGSAATLAALLADRRTEVDARNSWQETPLHLAVQAGDAACVRLLLAAGADAALLDAWDRDALAVAAASGLAAISAVLAETPHRSADSAASALTTAVSPSAAAAPAVSVPPANKPLVLSRWMEAPLDEAVALHKLRLPGVDVVTADYYKWTAAHKAAAWDKPELLAALLQMHAAAADTLGANGETPLHSACSANALRCVDVLLAHGGLDHLCLADNDGNSPLHVAAAAGNEAVVAVLLAAGAPGDARNKSSQFAYHLAALGGAPESLCALLLAPLSPEQRADAEGDVRRAKEEEEQRRARPRGKLAARLLNQQVLRPKEDE